ncbi:MAG: endonuclease domain-containing protein [Chloroherpetonaceae bacterium]
MSRCLVRTPYHLPYNPDLKERARALRKNMTDAEKKLWQFLRRRPEQWLRQRPIDNFIADFYCAAFRLVVEVDGAHHFTDEGKARDEARTAVLNGYGIRVERFSNRDVLENFEGVCQAIESMCSPPV